MSFAADEVRRLSNAILELHALPLEDGFLDGLLRILHGLLPAEHSLYGVTNLSDRMTVMGLAHPRQVDVVRWLPVFDAHFWDHPLHDREGAHRPGELVSTQDAGVSGWRGSGLRNEFCLPLAMDEQLLVRLPAPADVVQAVGIARSGGTFSDNERLVLATFADHVRAVWARRERLQLAGPAAMPLDERATRLEIVRASDGGHIHCASERALLLLADFFPGGRAGRLPPELVRWLREALAPDPARSPSSFTAGLSATSGARALDVYLAGRSDGTVHLYLHEHAATTPATVQLPATSPAAAPALPAPEPGESESARIDRLAHEWRLTGRQRDVLRAIVHGDSNKQIAARLGCAEVTVEMHLTAMFRKAGVSGRINLLARTLRAS